MSHLVVAVVYDGLCTFEFGCAVEVFGISRPELGVGWYDFAVHSCDKGELLRAAGGVELRVRKVRGLLQRAQTIIVPGWRGVDVQAPAPLLDQLRRAHARGARVCSICSGAFVLAQAGLLDGLRGREGRQGRFQGRVDSHQMSRYQGWFNLKRENAH